MDKNILIFIIKLVVVYEGFQRGWKLKKNDDNKLVLTKKIINLKDDDIFDFVNSFKIFFN